MKETKGTYICQYFKMPHLYRDDLASIEKIIQDQLKPVSYHLAFDGVEYESLQQIPSTKLKTNVLVFYTHTPCVRLKFSRSWSELYCAETNYEITAGLEQIKQILAKCERPALWRFAKYSSWSAPMVGLGAVGLTSIAVGQERVAPMAMAWALGVLAMAWAWWFYGFLMTVQKFSCLELQRDR